MNSASRSSDAVRHKTHTALELTLSPQAGSVPDLMRGAALAQAQELIRS